MSRRSTMRTAVVPHSPASRVRVRGSEPLAITAILATVLLLSLQDALVKQLSDDVGLWEIWALRSIVALALLVLIGALSGHRVQWASILERWTVARSALVVASWVVYSAALPHLPLAVVAAAFYTSPIMITVMAAPLAGETVGGRRWIAVGVGFVGMLLILQPGTDGFSWFAILPFAAAAMYALVAILTATKCGSIGPVTLSMALNVGFLLVGWAMVAVLTVGSSEPSAADPYAFMTRGWRSPGTDVTRIAGLGALGAIAALAGLGAAFAYQNGRLPVIATFDYGYLAFAVMWGLVFFADRPDLLTVVGMLVIAAAGLAAMSAPDPAAAPTGRAPPR